MSRQAVRGEVADLTALYLAPDGTEVAVTLADLAAAAGLEDRPVPAPPGRFLCDVLDDLAALCALTTGLRPVPAQGGSEPLPGGS